VRMRDVLKRAIRFDDCGASSRIRFCKALITIGQRTTSDAMNKT
jgi:hypothetical protein